MGYPICAKPDCYYTVTADDDLINWEMGVRGSGNFTAGLAHRVCPKENVNPEHWSVHISDYAVVCGSCKEVLKSSPTTPHLILHAVAEHITKCQV